jgi:hypothetical protein
LAGSLAFAQSLQPDKEPARRGVTKSIRALTMKCENVRVSDGRVRYARNGDVRLAYREFGHGDTTLVWIPGWFSIVRPFSASPRVAQ